MVMAATRDLIRGQELADRADLMTCRPSRPVAGRAALGRRRLRAHQRRDGPNPGRAAQGLQARTAQAHRTQPTPTGPASYQPRPPAALGADG
jgi:hypothetical protein